ncbi:hypothetical protein BN7_3947 [Wickerhamomyces ciferrii]|uniref:Uncharacterized protein n=1 Tax=Wickerhamomyces ciferrii (strain ATCC 14091 / BCRC 22168 / CBS 111 / JCM 3599 / NBRC 0793 / NRRL Y-1031 F-60-10) TaxID=1206466 RepID=K0KSP9_WICCF|nr:uncharacterized protein BN7_3947 [Wickerhamomyces ciferrii]CCH44384.1 hypothetical protein BN7_3947 [Wickerhamomyces ciferrii]
MGKDEKFINVWDLPTPLIRRIFVEDAKISFQDLKELYHLDIKFGPVLEASIAIVTNDLDIPHKAMTSIDGFEALRFDVYNTENLQQNDLMHYSFIYFMVNPRKFDSKEAISTFSETIRPLPKIKHKIQIFNKDLDQRISVRHGRSFLPTKMSDIYDWPELKWLRTSDLTKWDEFSFHNEKIWYNQNLNTMSSAKITTLIIRDTFTNDTYDYHDFKNLSFPNLQKLIIEFPSFPRDALSKVTEKRDYFQCDDAYEAVFKPTKQSFKLTFNSCFFPKLTSMKISSNAKIQGILNCDFSSLQSLEFSNNFLLYIKNTNFKNLKKLVINPTINITKTQLLGSNQILTEDQFDINLEGIIEPFCEKFNIKEDRITRFPSMFLDNVTLSSLKSLQVPHVNSILSAEFTEEFDDQLDEVVIEPSPPKDYSLGAIANTPTQPALKFDFSASSNTNGSTTSNGNTAKPATRTN